MTPHGLVVGRNPRILEETVHQTVGSQPASCDLARNEPGILQSLKDYRDIRLAAIGARLNKAVRGYLIDVSAEKSSLVYYRRKDRESHSNGTEKFLVKSIPSFRVLRGLIR